MHRFCNFATTINEARAIHFNDPFDQAQTYTTASRIKRSLHIATKSTLHAAISYVHCTTTLVYIILILLCTRAFAYVFSNRKPV